MNLPTRLIEELCQWANFSWGPGKAMDEQRFPMTFTQGK